MNRTVTVTIHALGKDPRVIRFPEDEGGVRHTPHGLKVNYVKGSDEVEEGWPWTQIASYTVRTGVQDAVR